MSNVCLYVCVCVCAHPLTSFTRYLHSSIFVSFSFLIKFILSVSVFLRAFKNHHRLRSQKKSTKKIHHQRWKKAEKKFYVNQEMNKKSDKERNKHNQYNFINSINEPNKLTETEKEEKAPKYVLKINVKQMKLGKNHSVNCSK